MDDDLTFGASVWGADVPSPFPPTKLKPPTLSLEDDFISTPNGDDGFDDFEDFGPTETVAGDEDDFGDFGDAIEDIAVTPADFPETPVAGPSKSQMSKQWEPLRLDPFPDRQQLERDIDEILEPVWDDEEAQEQVFTKDGIRDIEGVNQILVTNERYVKTLFHSFLSRDLGSTVENCTKCFSERPQQPNLRTGHDLEYEGNILSP